MSRQQMIVKASYVIAYLLIVLAGVLVPTQLTYIPHHFAHLLWYVTSIWLSLGSIIALLGQVRRRWTGEFVGLPFVCSASFGFGLLQGGLGEWHLSVIPSVALLWAIAALCFARWRDIWRLYYAANRIQRGGK